MTRVHLVTGATGFVGSALVLELLRETDDFVICIARPADDSAAATQRLHSALEAAARGSEQEQLLERARGRLRALPGDLLCERCGVRPERVGRVDEVWHAAATLRFEAAQRDWILRHNEGGTRQMLALARALDAGRFNYVSTAYVSGSRTGDIPEELAPRDGPVNNAYEESKVLAEHLVAESGLAYRILRPSIVIGYSKTCAAVSDDGFYGYLRRLAALRRLAQRKGQLAELGRAQLWANADAPLHLIPVDAVARNAVRISLSSSAARVFHLVNAAAPSVGDVSAAIGRRLGLDGPYVGMSTDREPSAYDELFSRQMTFFTAYVDRDRRFGQHNTDAAIGREASWWPLDAEGLERYIDRFLRDLRAGRPQPDRR
jgi:nucleoside-diphosphate-sugar epimerase